MNKDVLPTCEVCGQQLILVDRPGEQMYDEDPAVREFRTGLLQEKQWAQ